MTRRWLRCFEESNIGFIIKYLTLYKRKNIQVIQEVIQLLWLQLQIKKARKFVYNKDGVWDAETLRREIKQLTKKMHTVAENLEFEEAAQLRDAIHKLEDDLLLVE